MKQVGWKPEKWRESGEQIFSRTRMAAQEEIDFLEREHLQYSGHARAVSSESWSVHVRHDQSEHMVK
jgi:hypothetical protein